MANEKSLLNPTISYTLDIEKKSQDKTFQPHVKISSIKKPDTNESFVGAVAYDTRGEGHEPHMLIDQYGNIMPTIGRSIGALTGNVLSNVSVAPIEWSSGTPEWTTIAEVPITAKDECFTEGGRWLVTFTCRFAAANGSSPYFGTEIAGVCGVGITSTEEEDEAIPLIRRNIVPMVNGCQTYATVTAVMDIPYKNGIAPKLIFKAFHTAGRGALKTANRFTAVRLGDIPAYKKLGYDLEQEGHIDPRPEPSWPPFDPIFPKPEPITDPIPYPPVVDK